MKLLLDQNLSRFLVRRLADVFPESIHVQEIKLNEADDQAIWNFAKDAGYTVVSKDWDFLQRSILYGAPPKVIWIQIGNCSTSQIESVLRAATIQIIAFDRDTHASLLVLR